LAFQLHELAQREGDQAERLVALRTLGSQLVIRAKFSEGLELTSQGLTIYEPDQHRSLAFVYGQDVGVVCRQWSAWALWFLGYPDKALSMSRKTTLLAQETSHPMTEVYVGVFTAMFHRFRRDMEPARKLADKAAKESADQGFELFLASANAVKGSLVALDSMDDGIALMKAGVAGWRATGAELFVPFFLALLAEAYGEAGREEEGLAALDEALAIVDKSGKDGERLWDAELSRVKGELLLGNSDAVQAEACFHEALRIARAQGAKSWELRASVSLCHLWKKQGRLKEGRALLREIYNWFTEGFDTPDLVNAKALLDELG
jgi:predicted ATPase